jgi:carbonic anhydrase
MQQRLSRREILRLAGAAGMYAMAPSIVWPDEPHAAPVDAAAGLQRLKAGNLRFSSGKSQHTDQDVRRIKEIAPAQRPFATVLGCSDSRVPPEVIFDQGLGDLFTVRVAGNIVSTEVLGSVEYAALHLHTQLIVVVGHEDCGAVKAALTEASARTSEPPAIQTLLAPIEAVVREAHVSGTSAAQMTQAVEANANQAAAELRKALQESAKLRLLVRPAIYEVRTGIVRWL